MPTNTRPAGEWRSDLPCLRCGVDGFIYDDGDHMVCTDCGGAWPTSVYVSEMAAKLGNVDREPTYMERVRELVDNPKKLKLPLG
jgi:hypothetical protein